MNTFMDILQPILIIGFVSFLLSLAGHLLGVSFGKLVQKLYPEVLAGIILIGIGIKILIEHLS